jgi:phospholipid/cholesterol/gamma-HCH transport system ATP-binding protein
LPVWQNVAFRLRRARKPMPRRAARRLAIGKLARVGLARAIATDPKVIFFDEPTAGLDPIMAGVINDLIRELVTEMGATAITITHDMTTVRTVADQVAMLHGGVMRWIGPVAEIEASGDPYLDQFIHGRAEGPIAAVR